MSDSETSSSDEYSSSDDQDDQELVQDLFMVAVASGNINKVNSLLDQIDDINFTDATELTPFLCAIKHGKMAIASLILDRGGDFQAVDENGWDCLFFATYYNRIEIVKFLLTNVLMTKEKLNRANYGGWTAFNSAAESGHEEIFQILLEEPGNNINKGDCVQVGGG